MHYDKNQSTYDINACHKRNNLFQYSSQSFCSTEENEGSNSSYKYADSYAWNIDIHYDKHFLKCRTDRVGLHHISHETEGKRNKNSKGNCHHFSQCSLECGFNIVNRSAGYLSVLFLFIGLRKNGLSVDGSHSEECGNPHPENGSGSATYDSGCRSGKVTCTNLCRNRCCDSLERRHLSCIMLFPVQIEMSENQFEALAKTTQLNKLQTESVINTCSTQKEDEQKSP